MRKLTFLLIFSSVFAFSQSPWTQKEGKFYTQLSFTTIPSYNTIFGDPEYNTFGNISDNTIQFYGEYGISDKTTLILNLPFKSISIKDFVDPRIQCITNCSQDFSKSSLGNVELGLKHNFSSSNWIISGQLNVEINSGSYDVISGIRTGYDAWTISPMFLAGKSFGSSFLQTFAGVQIRTNNYSSNIRFGGEYGGKILDKLWLIGFVDAVISMKNGDIVLPQENIFNALYVNNQEYGAFGAKAIYEFTNSFGLNAGFGGAFFGNNVAKSPALTFGIFQKF